VIVLSGRKKAGYMQKYFKQKKFEVKTFFTKKCLKEDQKYRAKKLLLFLL
jgi:hypothetical protein